MREQDKHIIEEAIDIWEDDGLEKLMRQITIIFSMRGEYLTPTHWVYMGSKLRGNKTKTNILLCNQHLN